MCYWNIIYEAYFPRQPNLQLKWQNDFCFLEKWPTFQSLFLKTQPSFLFLTLIFFFLILSISLIFSLLFPKSLPFHASTLPPSLSPSDSRIHFSTLTHPQSAGKVWQHPPPIKHYFALSEPPPVTSYHATTCDPYQMPNSRFAAISALWCQFLSKVSMLTTFQPPNNTAENKSSPSEVKIFHVEINGTLGRKEYWLMDEGFRQPPLSFISPVHCPSNIYILTSWKSIYIPCTFPHFPKQNFSTLQNLRKRKNNIDPQLIWKRYIPQVVEGTQATGLSGLEATTN